MVYSLYTFCLSSSCVLCVQYCQCTWIVHSFISNCVGDVPRSLLIMVVLRNVETTGLNYFHGHDIFLRNALGMRETTLFWNFRSSTDDRQCQQWIIEMSIKYVQHTVEYLHMDIRNRFNRVQVTYTLLKNGSMKHMDNSSHYYSTLSLWKNLKIPKW